MITESDQLAAAIDRAAQVCPDLTGERADLLRYIIDRGIETIDAERQKAAQVRKKAIMEVAGSLSGVWPENWREEMRAGWPE